MKKTTLFVLPMLFFMALPFNSQGQIIPNMSFEGSQGSGNSPNSWSPCHAFSTPDTQPGFWEVSKEASEGETFVSLVTRGNLGPYANNNEDIQAKLLTTIRIGEEYYFTIDLSHSKSYGHTIGWGDEFLKYDTPAKLQIFGGSSSCQQEELLWESEAINYEEWKTHPLRLAPKNIDVSYLILKAAYVSNSTYFGNVLIDNFQECSIDLSIPSDTTICQRESWVLDVSIPNGTYQWQDGSENPIYTIRQQGEYKVTVSNACLSKTFSVNVNTRDCLCDTTMPIQIITFDTLICEGDFVQLDASVPDGNYLWSNSSEEAHIEVSQAGIYSVEVSNQCETVSFDFEVQIQSCDCTIEAPNVFTPNNDGFNDLFEIKGASNIARYQLTIFNRHGRKVYETSNIEDFWSGKYQGELVPSGVYFWSISILCIRNGDILEKAYKGIVSVLR